MKTIWKFPLTVTDQQDITMPRGADVLCVQTQRGEPHLWALVDTDAETVKRTVHIIGTGHQADHVENLPYVGTFTYMTSLVFHVFDGWHEAEGSER